MAYVVLLILALGGATVEAKDRCDSIVNAATKKWDEQKSFRFPPTAITVDSIRTAPIDPSTIPPLRQSLVATTGGYGLAATFTPSSDERPGVLHVQVNNEKYHAMVTRLLSSDVRVVSRLDQFTDGYRNAGFSGLTGSEIWVDRAIRAEASGGFLARPIFDLKQYVLNWNSMRASLEFSEGDSSERPHKLTFSKLSGEAFSDVEYCEFLIDIESFLVVGVTCATSEGVSNTEVKSFVDIEGVKFPSEFQQKYVAADSTEYRYDVTVKVQPLDSVGFKKEQLYLSYYGLAEPNAEAIAKPMRYSGFVYLAIGVSLGLVCAFLYWRKTR